MLSLLFRLRMTGLLCSFLFLHPLLLRCVADDSVAGRVGQGKRIPWSTSRVSGTPEPTAPFRTEPAFPQLKFVDPTVLTISPTGRRWFLAELTGKIYTFPDKPDCQQADVQLFVNLAEHIANAQHVYGLAFHPDYQQNHFIYICYLAGKGFAGDNRVSRFTVKGDDPPRCDPTSEQILIEWSTGGHNGGCLEFGPDGYLYISTGDGASPSPPDPSNTGQDITDLKSSILRIDVNRSESGRPYAIPPENPFLKIPGARPEVWAYGFRNPWKMSFDPGSGHLWVGDVGWDLWEMVFRVKSGDNCGWSVVEGSQTIRPDLKPGPTPIQPPVMTHPRSDARSVTGGYVYRGQQSPDLVGHYVYGDFVTGKIWKLRYDGKQVTGSQELVDTPFRIITFAEGYDHELYVVDYDGTIHRLIPNPVTAANQDFPHKLSESGLFASVVDQQPAGGVLPYSVNAEPWADGAQSKRLVALPQQEQLTVYKATNLLAGERKGEWRFPRDSVLVKTLYLNLATEDPSAAVVARPVETQILHKEGEQWRGYTYLWNSEFTDATLVPAAGTQRVYQVVDPAVPGGRRQQSWAFQSRGECLLCHSPRAGSVLGFHEQQLRQKPAKIPAQSLAIDELVRLGLFADPIDVHRTALVDPYDPNEAIDERARSLLDVNCAHCHGNGGGASSPIRLQRQLTNLETGMIDGRLTQGDFGIRDARVVVPGDPFRSILYYRMAKIGPGRMPHVGSKVVDVQGLRLIQEWIRDQSPQAPQGSPTTGAQEAGRRKEQAQALDALIAAQEPAVNSIDLLLKDIESALALLTAVYENRFSAATRQKVIERGIAASSPQIRDLFDPFVPEEKRQKTVELIPLQVLGLNGQIEVGEKLFFSDLRLQCKNCHQIGERGKSFGPNLSKIGRKYEKPELLTSLLKPSEKIDPEFVPFILTTKSGTVHSGLIAERKEEVVVLKDNQGQLIRVAEKDVDELLSQSISIMPEGTLRDLTPQEAADLLSYLRSLR